MSYPKIVALVTKLANATSNGLVEWKSTESEDAFQISFSGHSVRISKRDSRKDPLFDEYFLQIFNEEGDLVEEVGDEDGEDDAERQQWYADLRETFETGRRQAMGVDAVLDDILRDLDRHLPF